MKLNFSMIVLAAAPCLVGCTAATQRMDTANNLQGTWSCVSAMVDGRALPPETTRLLRLTLTQDRYKTVKGEEILFDSTYTLNSSVNPRQINMVGTEGELTGKEAQGIYALEDGLLRICYRMPGLGRPIAFESPTGSNSYYTIWKRDPR
jgi:uncharacterized protein (TIGR03067 family)